MCMLGTHEVFGIWGMRRSLIIKFHRDLFMLRAFYWRLNLGLKKIRSKRLRKKLGKNIKAIITTSQNGIFAVDPEDLEVGQNFGQAVSAWRKLRD